MAHNQLVLGCFDSLWHYGLPSSTPPPTPPHLFPVSHTPSLPCEALNIVSRQCSLQSLFSLLDEDGDGQLCLREIHSLLTRLALRSSSQNDTDLLSVIHFILSPNEHQHASSTGHDLLSLDFPQFAKLYASLFPASQNGAAQDAPPAGGDDLDDELLDAFRIYDTNRDGFISAAELAAVLSDLKLLPAIDQQCNIDAHVERCQAYIDCVDLDGNGMVDLEEFKAMMMTSQHSSSRISVFAQ